MQNQLTHPNGNYVLIAAHRGLWRDTPENSETGLRNSLAKWEMVETDLRKTTDWSTVKDLVITHDPDIARTTDGYGYLYKMTMAQVTGTNCKLLDRYGAPYTGGNWYPSNSSGTPAQDGVQHMLKLSDLLRIQRDFLTGTDTDPLGPIIIMDVKGASPQEKQDHPELGTDSGVFDTINTAINLIKNLSFAQRRSLIFMVKYNLLGSKSDFETAVSAYQNYNDATNPLPKLMLIFNPEDSQDKNTKVSIAPAANTNFQNWAEAPYLSHFEMNQTYLGDGCQTYINYLTTNGYGISTYSENAFFPEGVWNINQFNFRNTNFAVTPVDFREVPDYALANTGVGLVTTERPDEMDAILRQYSLRTLPIGG